MSSAAVAGAAAAQQQLLLQHKEEEELTKYSDAELQGEWEFKILRSNFASFRKPEVLQQVCAEEARAGWTLLEKFDDQRLRFKRPVSARSRDLGLDFDPYRTQFGAGSASVVAVIIVVTLVAVCGIFALVAIFVRK
jgi:hypothetical protein